MSRSVKPAEPYGLPWPEGDAPALADAARSADAAASSLGSAAASLASSASGPTGWRGSAAEAFHDAIVTERDGMRRSATALDEASTALRRLAERVTSAQAEVRRLASEVGEAEAAATAAGARALGVPILTPGDPAPGAARREADADRARAASARAYAHADEVRTHAMRRAQHVCDRLHSADAATARAVEHAASLAPMGGRTRSLGPTPAHVFGAQAFRDLSRSDLQQLAYFLAGINQWDIDQGLLANDSRDLKQFEAIASGVPARVAAANKEMLRHEQRKIIQDDYDAIRDRHGAVGGVFSFALTWTANNPIPGGDSYREDFHDTVRVPTGPVRGLDLKVDVPTGNVAIFDDRWRWIEQDMLPKYRGALGNPDALQRIIDRPVADRADDLRLIPGPYPGG